MSLGSEVLIISKKGLEINCSLIKKHTSNSWSLFLSKYILDCWINCISYKIITILTLKGIKLTNINFSYLQWLDLWLYLLLR